MSKDNLRQKLAGIVMSDRSRDWKKEAKRHLLDDLDAEVAHRSAKLAGIKLGSGRVLCTKTKFKSEELAQKRLGEILAETYGENKNPCRAYECQHCGN